MLLSSSSTGGRCEKTTIAILRQAGWTPGVRSHIAGTGTSSSLTGERSLAVASTARRLERRLQRRRLLACRDLGKLEASGNLRSRRAPRRCSPGRRWRSRSRTRRSDPLGAASELPVGTIATTSAAGTINHRFPGPFPLAPWSPRRTVLPTAARPDWRSVKPRR